MVEMQETAQHPAPRHVAQPGRPRRDRPRHGDVRRAEHRVGGRRAPRDQPARPAEDAVRHALPRAHRSGRRAAGRRQLSRRGARVARRDRVPAQDRARADRIAATASRSRAWPGCRRAVVDRAREILTALEQDELARGGRPSVTPTRDGPQQQLGLFQFRRLPDRPRRAPARHRYGSPHAAGGADPARRAEERRRRLSPGGFTDPVRTTLHTSSTLAVTVLAACVLASVLPAAAATRYARSLRFRSITTSHFVIHYHQGEEALALRLSLIAERVHTDLTARMQHAPGGRTHVVLVDQADDPNGWATPVPYNLIEITAVPPAGAEAIGNTSEWLRLVFTHEYAHVIHLDRSRGLGSTRARRLRTGAVRVPEPHVAALAHRGACHVRRKPRRRGASGRG